MTEELTPQWYANSVQNITHLPLQYGRTLDTEVLKHDALYGLSELYTFVADSENQFLNFMESHVLVTLRNFHGQEEFAQSSLRYGKALLQEHIQNIQEMLRPLRYEGKGKWPQASKAPYVEVARVSKSDLLSDFECLLQKASALTKRCIEGQALIVNDSTLKESKKAMEQAEGLIKLTRLAFFFVPLSFTTSFFGMNFIQFGQGGLSIWIAFITCLPVIALTGLILYWDSLHRRAFEMWRARN